MKTDFQGLWVVDVVGLEESLVGCRDGVVRDEFGFGECCTE